MSRIAGELFKVIFEDRFVSSLSKASFFCSNTFPDSSVALQTSIPPATTTYLPTKPIDPSVTEIVPYQPVDIVCSMFQANFEINLWQESTPGTFIQRAADGVAIIRQGNAFTITQGRQNDEGTYYCQAANSQKILAAVLTFPGKVQTFRTLAAFN